MKTMKRRLDSDKIFDAVNSIFLFIVLIIVAIPLLYVISASLSDPLELATGNVILLPKKITLEGYKRVMKNADIWIGYKNSLVYTFVGVFINLFMTTLGAYPLSRKDLYGKDVFAFIFAFTMFFHGGLIPTYLLIKQLHMLDSIWVMVVPVAVNVTNLIIMRTFFQTTIPDELLDAASIDGCSNMSFFLRIVMPLSKAIFAVMALYYGVFHWNQYFRALIYISSREKLPLQVFLREILLQNQMQDFMDNTTEDTLEQVLIGEMVKYCVIIVASVPVLLFYPYIQKYFVKGVMIGAIKG